MLTITVGATDVFDDETATFGTQDGVELQLEHSLVSLSKWETIYERPFLGAKDLTGEENLAYIECMILTPNPPEDILHKLSEQNIKEINTYIDKKSSATWFSEQPGSPQSREIITSELIYYWMSAFQIDWQAQHWHLNRLFTLIRVANLKQAKPKKMSPGEVARRNRELNEQRKRQLGTKG